MAKANFCRNVVYLGRQLISFVGRPYLQAIYASQARNLVLRRSRQTEKSTFLANTILYEACRQPGIQILFVRPRQEQAHFFSRSRLLPCLENSPIISRYLLGKRHRRPQVMNLQFRNGSALIVRAAFLSGDACRGISADLLLVDEFQDIAEGNLPVLQETLSHAKYGRTILTGTPKSIDNHLDSMFRQSTANEWTVPCAGCQRGVILDERSLGPNGLACPGCGGPLDPAQGHWVPRNPGATWGAGYWIGHPMVPWLDYEDILERQRVYEIARFKNEALGLPTTTGDHIVTREELEACCEQYSMAQLLTDIPAPFRQRLVAGIDWGGGGPSRTVLVIGYMADDFRFHICRLERFARSEEPKRELREVAQRCRQFRVQAIAADGGGNGHVLNRLLLDMLDQRGLWAILYSAADQEPHREGGLMKWTVNRSATIGVLFSRIKRRQLLFPRVEDSGTFLDEFRFEVAEYNDNLRTVQDSDPESERDDVLHATNYALALAIRALHQSHR